MRKDVSVVIPVFNAERYLSETLNSVVGQSLKNIEIICVDDGSSDNSYEILNEYKTKDHRVTVLTQNHLYAGIARNRGLELATGKYVIFLDSDDLFDEMMLEKAYESAEQNRSDIVIFGGYGFEGDISNIHDRPHFCRAEMLANHENINCKNNSDIIFNITSPAPWNKLFLKDFINREGLQFEGCKRANDFYFVEAAIGLAERISIIDKKLIYYRENSAGGLQCTKTEDIKSFLNHYTNSIKKLTAILEKNNVMNVANVSFNIMILSRSMYNLDSIKDFEAFKLFFNELKNVTFRFISIDSIQVALRKKTNNESFNRYMRYIESLYEKYVFLMNNSPEDFFYLYEKDKMGKC